MRVKRLYYVTDKIQVLGLVHQQKLIRCHICMQVRKQQLELDMEQQTGSK